MKKFTVLLLSVIVVTLIAGSVQSAAADHLEPGIGLFKDETMVNIVDSMDSKYKIYLHAVLRNGDGQLISVVESTENGAYIPHKITDYAFDTVMGKKEISTIDNTKYEKVQYIFSPTLEERFALIYPVFAEIPFTFTMTVEDEAEMNSEGMEYPRWKIDYCAILVGHDYMCIPIFQAMVPNITLEPDDVVTQYWTILREMN
tara:strand:- start:462 stop:1064 length:603 start_codon:yes stop_codon:yes gene_type:complete